MGLGSSRHELGCRRPAGGCAGSVAFLHAVGCANKGRFSKELQHLLLCDRTVAAARGSVPEPAPGQEAAGWSVPLLPPELVPWAQPTQRHSPVLSWVQQAVGRALPACAVGPQLWGSSCGTCRALGARRAWQHAVLPGWGKGCSGSGV